MAQNMSELLTLYPMYRLIDVFLMVCHAKNHCYHPAKTPVSNGRPWLRTSPVVPMSYESHENIQPIILRYQYGIDSYTPCFILSYDPTWRISAITQISLVHDTYSEWGV